MNVIYVRKDSNNNYLISGSCRGKQINTRVYIGYTKRDAIAKFRTDFNLKHKHIDILNKQDIINHFSMLTESDIKSLTNIEKVHEKKDKKGN